jgi:hypothetical protein
VDIAPHWGEPHISCVCCALCDVVDIVYDVYLLSALIFMYDR